MLNVQEGKLKECFNKLPYNITEDQTKTVIKEVIEDDLFVIAQQKLNSEFKRTRYIQENMTYIEPREIILNSREVRLGAKKEVIHYVPVTESLKALLEDESFNNLLANSNPRQEWPIIMCINISLLIRV